MKTLITLIASLPFLSVPAFAETWYLVVSVNSRSAGTELSIVEMDSQQGCEVAGNKLDGDVKSNKLENIDNFSYTCIKRQ